MRLILEDLKKNFDKKKVLQGATFAFEQGKIYGLLGRNGAGKTTLFNCLNEDLPIDGGRFGLEENGVFRALDTQDIGYVLSTPVVPEFLTAREFLRFFIDINADRAVEMDTPDAYLDFMRIDASDRDKLLKDFSHGMKNKIQMLIHLIAKPPVLLLDEPLTSFDVVTADEMKNMLRQIKAEHITVLSTHIMELALDLCDEIVVLSRGELHSVEKIADAAAYRENILSLLKEEAHAKNV